MKNIKQFLVNGEPARASKTALTDDVVSSLLPLATAEDSGKSVVVGSAGAYELSAGGLDS